MSEEGDKTCPLCAEEMDLTDQQLKPCKCGYDICVWCWHHIMDMAEKEQTKGRCPACRTPYNKEKIVTAANSGRLASELNVERRAKSQKGKSRTEGRKHLTSVRVIQKNLVYVVGLPLNCADEDLLQRKEYFGQYGKVLKVSISRTAGGAIQQFPNSTCSVYITYSKEDEAIRCIQSAHGFVLDGKPLRACFGTTKYCHAWLRNMPCNNPDCLYLHEIGSQEDSFTKDEIVSAYTRVQQFTSSSNALQQRSGNVLPPPSDDYCNNGSTSLGKPINKTSVSTNQNPAISSRISPPNSSSGRSSALPAGASWGTRASSSQNIQGSTSNGPLTQKSETPSSTVVRPGHKSSLHHDDGSKLAQNDASSISQNNSKEEMAEKEFKTDGWSDDDEESIDFGNHVETFANGLSHDVLSTKLPSNGTVMADISSDSDRSGLVKDFWDVSDQGVDDVPTHFSSLSICQDQHVDNGYVEVTKAPMTTKQTSFEAADKSATSCSLDVQLDHRLGSLAHSAQADFRETENDSLSFESRRPNDTEVSIDRVDEVPHEFNLSRHSTFNSSIFSDVDKSIGNDAYTKVVDRGSELMFPSSSHHYSINLENVPNMNGAGINEAGYFTLFPSKDKQSPAYGGASNRGEESIISNILSTDFDMWNDSLSSKHNLVKLLGEGDVQQRYFGAVGSQRPSSSSQSRFGFAREDEPIHQASDFRQSIDYFDKSPKQQSLGYDFSTINNSHSYSRENRKDLSLFSGSESDLFSSILPRHSSSKLSVPRSPMPAPPGFSPSSRPPPPGFASHERTDQLLDNFSGNHMVDTSSLSRNQYHTPSPSATNIFSDSDIEFMDPAILAVGKGVLPTVHNYSSGLDIGHQNLPPQFAMSEEPRFQSMLQRSLPPQQNRRYNNSRDSFSLLGDASYGIPSRAMEQTLANSLSSFSQSNVPLTRNGITSNGQWNGWSEIQGGKNLGMPDYLRAEGLGINKFFGSHEDSQIRMPNSGNLFNGTYGM